MSKSIRWGDVLSVVFSIAIVLGVAAQTLQSFHWAALLSSDQPTVWYLIRSTGITAYVLLTVATLWGLALSSRVVKDWSPGALSMLLHSTVSGLAIVASIIHATLPLFDDYFTYHLRDILIPFNGPYRPLAVGLGTLSLWIILAVGLTFPLRKQLGNRLWKLIHFSSYLGFGLISMHALFAGADASKIGFQIMIAVSVLFVAILLGYRVGNQKRKVVDTAKAAH